MLTLPAPAKLNLALHITGRRADGYHTISSLVAFANIGDLLCASPEESGIYLSISGDFSDTLNLSVSNNLVLRAAHRLREASGVKRGARLILEKYLPVASGIGGGSSDAAAAALLLNELWELGLSPEQLSELLLPLGADIPMCICKKPALAEGVGEILLPLADVPRFPLVLANPGVALSTADVFRLHRRNGRKLSDKIHVYKCDDWISSLKTFANDLQAPACELAPVIGQALEAIAATPGCLLARMSGSGATCFGLYTSAEAADNAAALLQSAHPQWWVRAGVTLPSETAQTRAHS